MKEQQLTLNGSAVISKQEQRQVEKDFVDGMLSIFRPKIVWPGYEGMPIPEQIKTQILIERLILARNNEKLATETEALWYLSTASLVAPMDNNWYNIFMYLSRRYLTRTKKELPDFLKENIILDEYVEEPELHRLRQWLYNKGMEATK